MPYADCISMKSSNSNSGRHYYFNWIAGVGTNHEKKIAGSEYTEIEGMGHDLGMLPVLIERILPFLRKNTPVE